MADWPTVASLATAGGTLILAVATFSSVRSGQRATRIAERSSQIAERALLIGLRPVMVPSRASDPPEAVRFVEGRMIHVEGGMAGVEREGENYYFVIGLRNVGTGLGVLQAWHLTAPYVRSEQHAEPAAFREQTRDLYVPAGDIGMWQGALRNPDDPVRAATAAAIDTRQPITIELLYSDQVGLQRTITRFSLIPTADSWLAAMTRHWYLDWDGPRPDSQVRAAVDAVHADIEAAERLASGTVGMAGGETADGAPPPAGPNETDELQETV
jgi:hypothetical protein